MSTQHTPGPWAVLVGHDGSISVAADGPRRINLTTAGTPVIADVCRHADAEHFSGEANAHLIAAAPDLLAALREARRVIATALKSTNPDWFPDDESVTGHLTIQSIDAAIAKATNF